MYASFDFRCAWILQPRLQKIVEVPQGQHMHRIVVVTVDVFALRRTTAIVMNSRDDVSHTVPFLNSGLHPVNILLMNVLWDPRDNREHMTQFVSETVECACHVRDDPDCYVSVSF